MEETTQRVAFPMINGPFGVPEKPDFSVGLDAPLRKAKMELLNEPVSTILVTGFGGSGKTTLATMLCWDEHIKGKFRENIFFVTLSKTPELKIIVGRVFEHLGHQVPKFEDDEEAINELGILLRKLERSPMLLVLDDVWPGSEDLVEKFKFHLADYKILVTSRVAFPRFGTPCVLKPLVLEDAMTLFRHHAFLDTNRLKTVHGDVIQKVVESCMGLPLAIKVIGRSLSHEANELWQKMVLELSHGNSILDSNTELLTYLLKILDVLEDNRVIKECFMDLSLFPEDQRIPVTALIDMWAELYGLDNDGIEAMVIINKLDSMNLANVLVARKNTSDTDNYYYNNHFIVLHDLLRELAIYQSTLEPIEERKRLTVDTDENQSEWGLDEKQQGIVTRILSNCFKYCVKQKPQRITARTLSISIGWYSVWTYLLTKKMCSSSIDIDHKGCFAFADESCSSYWSHMHPAQAKVLILNLRGANQYSFPESMQKMSKLKVLIITNYNFHPSELTNFELLGSLSNLKRIRLERISVLSFVTLKTLKKLSLYNMSHGFQKGIILISDAFPNLVDLNIDYCKDMVVLPSGLCDIIPLKKLSVTNCHKLLALPQEIGKLVHLELLRLTSCTDLEGLPESTGRLSNLRHLDISNCINLSNLPEDFGNLCNLRNLTMINCARCELPYSVINLVNLKVVSCDEETAASWEGFKAMLPNLQIEVPQVDTHDVRLYVI
ncbi:unnamed protein product [Sphenostylis stenocarpa]|uniref:NB-ARC domain-containing protein n=1 Tax=Sphenostylis stenocarpa TaxID=92480 RepID=A0AA86S5V4_9FABA|nr:unnamed protein product [Sphenostylis stenocarpa]